MLAPGAAGIVEGVSALELDSVARAIGQTQPDAVVNCIGIVKQLAGAKDPILSIEVNSLFPHRLSLLAREAGARLLHISTDCVFSGIRGNYSESDVPDPIDLYGRSKLLGEVADAPALTLRTSIIGRELHDGHGLVEWFLAQDGPVRGFRRASFSGLTTAALARLIGDVLEAQPDLTGLWHVAAEPITKFDLLHLLRDAHGLETEIEPDDDFFCDRTLDGTPFRERTGLTTPPWPEMIAELAMETARYAELREAEHAHR
jgi:dTDP-4-dehydrorhamnose reductase